MSKTIDKKIYVHYLQWVHKTGPKYYVKMCTVIVYNVNNIHKGNNENIGKMINPPSYPHCPHKKT